MREVKIPEAIESEKSVLAALLVDHTCARQVADLVTPEDFYDAQNQKVMSAVYSLLGDGVAVELSSLLAKLGELGHMQNGLGAYVGNLMNNFPAAIDIGYHCGLIRQAARKREVLQACNKVLQDGGTDFEACALNAERRLKTYREDAAKEKGARSGFELVPIGEFKNNAPDWLVRGLVERDSFGLIFADPGAGKSLLGIDLACCIALQKDFHGHLVEAKGAVIYIAGEGHSGLGRRFKAWRIRHQTDNTNLPIFASRMPAGLCDQDQVAVVAQAIKAVAEKHGPLALIIVDTVARNFGPGNENDTSDMTRFIAGCDHLRCLYGSAVLLIHHSGHGAKDRARGSMALKGALDFEYRLEKDAGGTIRMETAKPPKDFEPPEPMAFVIRSVELGFTDQDGKQITGPILDQVEYEPRDQQPAGNTGRGKWQTAALDILGRLHREHRQRLTSSNLSPDSVRVVTIADWTSQCKAVGMSRSAFWKVKTALLEQGAIHITDGFVSSPYPSPYPSPPY